MAGLSLDAGSRRPHILDSKTIGVSCVKALYSTTYVAAA